MDKQKKTLLILAVLLGVALLGLLGAKKLADKKRRQMPLTLRRKVFRYILWMQMM